MTEQPENPFTKFIPDQQFAIVPSFTLESGVELHNVPVAYKTYGTLAPSADNAMVICHALTGSADAGDWWGPLLGGPGKAFDISRFFVVCLNSLGSPYGSASPVTNKDGDPDKGLYGPEFPLTTVRDDVNIFKLILDDLGVRQIAAVIGGSMGGMLVLEFAYFGKDYVRTIIPIATSARYSAWGISWGEAQRQSIYSDPKYDDGYYAFEDPPSTGLAAARMSALLTYRSRDSFESRFGRNTPDPLRPQNINRMPHQASSMNEHWAIHNEGHKNARSPRGSRPGSAVDLTTAAEKAADATVPAGAKTDVEMSSAAAPATPPPTNLTGPIRNKAKRTPTYFSAQSYLRYQGAKFIKRFDANCYIAITRKLDTHDVSRARVNPNPDAADTPTTDNDNNDNNNMDSSLASLASSNDSGTTSLRAALAQIAQPTLILGIQSDGLFTFAEQQELAAAIPRAELKTIDSPEGHDAFLLEFKQVNAHLLHFMHEHLRDVMERSPTADGANALQDHANGDGLGVTKSSTFGEAEVEDITAW